MKITFTELRKILAIEQMARDMEKTIAALLVERAALKQEILDLLAGDAQTKAKAEAAFAKSEANEAKMRAGLPASTA